MIYEFALLLSVMALARVTTLLFLDLWRAGFVLPLSWCAGVAACAATGFAVAGGQWAVVGAFAGFWGLTAGTALRRALMLRSVARSLA